MMTSMTRLTTRKKVLRRWRHRVAGVNNNYMNTELRSVKKVTTPPSPAGESDRKEKTEKNPGKRVYFGPFRVFDDGYLVGRAHVNLMFRKQRMLNVNVEIFDKGYYPYFRKKDLAEAVTLSIPLPVLKEVYELLGLKRLQKRDHHQWKKKVFRL